MSDLVSIAIDARMREPDGLRKMLVVSATAHVLAIVALVAVPSLVGVRAQPETIMSISLGPPGPVSGGMTPISGRPVQRALPTPELPKPQPVRPPAAKVPDMVEPTKTAPRPPVPRAPRDAASRTPTTGPQETQGQGRTDTGSQSMETGLSTGGTNGTGGPVNLGNFCDPQWLGQMVGAIQRNWQSRQSTAGTPIIRFVVQRDGALTDITVRQSAGQWLDLHASRAVQLTRVVPPLPACYPYPSFAVNLTFEYIR
jgi:TonB family protein